MVYEPKTKKYIVFLYCNVRASQSIHEEKRLWIAFEKISTTSSQILSAYCSCMAGAYECCNHIIATLYKVAYAHSMGWCTPSCTELACKWNQSTKKDIVPQLISDLIVRKNLSTKNENQKDCTNREGKCMKDLNEFDPRISVHQNRQEKQIEKCFESIQKIKSDAVVLRSLETTNNTNLEIKQFTIDNIITKTLKQNEHNETNDQDLTQSFLTNLCVNEEVVNQIEKSTRGQSDNPLWFELRKGRLTASKHHDIYTKVNTLT